MQSLMHSQSKTSKVTEVLVYSYYLQLETQNHTNTVVRILRDVPLFLPLGIHIFV